MDPAVVVRRDGPLVLMDAGTWSKDCAAAAEK
jgi:hypothetical protein